MAAMVEKTKVISRTSLAVGITVGLIFLCAHFYEVGTEVEADAFQPQISAPVQAPQTPDDLPVDSRLAILTSTNAFPGKDGCSPEYLLLEGRTIWHAEIPPRYPQWVEIAFPEPVRVTHLGIRSQEDSPGGKEHIRTPKDFVFQGSHEPNKSFDILKIRKWVDLLEVKNNAPTKGGEWKDWFFENNTAFRCYRIYITAGGDPGYLTIRQIRVDPAARLPGPVTEAPQADLASSAVVPLAATETISRVDIDPPKLDPVNFRAGYHAVMERSGIKTKEDAMAFSLDFWEKRRKIYFS